MSTKFSDFMKEHKLDGRRLIAASAKIEKFRPEDRAIKLAKRQVKAKAAAGGTGDDPKKEIAAKKPRTGRPVTERALHAALEGKSLTGPQKNRILRAVNALLAQKKGSAVELTNLF
ncbi:MAG: hypothetical protein U0271_08550 [Polyangiaceae bacterium]